MKLKDLKKIIDKMSKEELEQPLIYNSDDLCISGKVSALKKARVDFYYTGEDDPSQLYTKKQLLEEGYDKEDIESFDIEIPKNSYYITF